MTTRTRTTRACLARASLALLCASLVACGGGGGGNGGGGGGGGPPPAAPYIVASALSFAPGQAPAEFGLGGSNTGFEVTVQKADMATPITNAVVRVNGTTLPYSVQYETYLNELNLPAGASINVVVTVEGKSYSISSTQLSSFPTFTAPANNAVWSRSDVNRVSWNSDPPAGDTVHVVGLLGTTHDWPSNGFATMSSSARSLDIPANQLQPDDYLLLTGVSHLQEMSGAAPGSALLLGGFAYRRVSVIDGITELRISGTFLPATVVLGTSRNLLAHARKGLSEQEVTSLASWSSSNPAAVAVSGGVISAVGAGSAVISASYGGKKVDVPVRVFVPTPWDHAPVLTDSVSVQVDHAHSGRATLGGASVSLPLQDKWTTTLNGPASYPLVADGKVFVISGAPAVEEPGPGYGTSLYALDVATGAIAWGPIHIAGTYSSASHAYDRGKLFVLNVGGVLRSFDAATGAAGWSVELPCPIQSVPLVAANGILYLGGGGTGGVICAVDETDGSMLWKGPANVGMRGPFAVTSDGIFSSSTGGVGRLDLLTGTRSWHYSYPVTGGDGFATVFGDNLLFVHDGSREFPETGSHNAVFNPVTGAPQRSFPGVTMPAVGGGYSYHVHDGALSSVNVATGETRWSFTEDGSLVTAPLLIDDMVVAGSSTGVVYLLDAATGSELWSGEAPAGLHDPQEFNAPGPFSSMGVGGGYLLVPAGNTITGWKLVP